MSRLINRVFFLPFLCLCSLFACGQKLTYYKTIGMENVDEISLSWVHQLKLINGQLVILDNQRVIIADTAGYVLHKFGGFTNQPDNTMSITDIEVDNVGNYLVTTQFKNLLFSKSGKFLKEIFFKVLKHTGFGINPSQIKLRNERWYIFDQSNHNIKVFDKDFNMVKVLGNQRERNFSSEDRRHNVEKYAVSALIEPKQFFFYKENFLIEDFGGTLKLYDKENKLLSYKKLPDVFAWLPVYADVNDDIYVVHPDKREFYRYESDSLYSLNKLNQSIATISNLKHYQVTSFCMDGNNYYVCFHGSKYIIAIFDRKSCKLKHLIPSKILNDKIAIQKPSQIRVNNAGELLVQEDYRSYKKINLSENKITYLPISGGSIDISKENKILHSDTEQNRLVEYDSLGSFRKILINDSTLVKPYRIISRQNGIIIMNNYYKSPQVLCYSNTMILKQKITKNAYDHGFIPYSADIDKSGNIYIADGASVLVYNQAGKIIRQIGGYGVAIKSDLNTGLVKDKDKLKLKLGDYVQNPLHFESISHIEIYENLLYIATGSKLVITNLIGNIKGYIGGNAGTKIGEFDTIAHFTIWKGLLYIADYSNNRIVIYKINK